MCSPTYYLLDPWSRRGSRGWFLRPKAGASIGVVHVSPQYNHDICNVICGMYKGLVLPKTKCNDLHEKVSREDYQMNVCDNQRRSHLQICPHDLHIRTPRGNTYPTYDPFPPYILLVTLRRLSLLISNSTHISCGAAGHRIADFSAHGMQRCLAPFVPE